MTLRARLLLALAALLSTALIVSGGLIVGITRASLVDEIDRDLRTARVADVSPPGPGRPDDPTGRRFALIVYDADGAVIQELPSGFAVSPDPLPTVSVSGAAALPLGTIVERPARDGALTYRVLALRSQSGLFVVLGAPMRGVDGTVAALVRNLALVGLIVLGLMLVVGWLIIRRDLQPLEQITATAERISTGDLSQRVGVPDDHSEVGRLGDAFNTMLDQIEAAFADQQAALAAKEASEIMLRQFVADASHELRTPLTTVRGYADLHRAGGLDEPVALDQAMARIGSESRRMGTLVEDLLLLARLDQGRPLRREPVALSALVEDALNDLRALEPGRPVTTDVAPDVTVSGDEDRLRQAVGNLFANLRVHTPADSPVEVTLAVRDGNAELRVVDHGPGVEAAHVDHVFDRFYRADAGRSRDRGGSGLGLAITASIAAAHGGRISYSPTDGGGATFALTLPHG